MRIPIRHIFDHLLFTRTGEWWAVYEVFPGSFQLLSSEQQLQTHVAITRLMGVLPDETQILSVCDPVSRVALAEQMSIGVDTENAAWQRVLEQVLETQAGATFYQRRWFIAACIQKTTMRGAQRAGFQEIEESFGLPPRPVQNTLLYSMRDRAEALQAKMNAHIRVAPTDSAVIRWLWDRVTRRVVDEPPASSYRAVRKVESSGQVSSACAATALCEARLFEGGRERFKSPWACRYVEIETAQGTGYLTTLAVSGLPEKWRYPGSGGWLFLAEGMPYGVDWAAHLHKIPNVEARYKVRKKDQKLGMQYAEYREELSGTPSELLSAHGVARELREKLASTEGDLLEVLLICQVWGPDPNVLGNRAEAFRSAAAAWDCTVHPPTGEQTSFLSSVAPAGRSKRKKTTGAYWQWMLGEGFAACEPFAGIDIGDPYGFFLGHNVLSGTSRPVFYAPEWGPTVANRSGCIGIVGDPGNGKSYMTKRIAHAIVARGGMVVALDRTQLGEYVTFANAVAEHTGRSVDVVSLGADSNACVDPLRLFPKDEAISAAAAVCCMLTGAIATDPKAVAIEEAVAAAAESPDPSLSLVLDHLERSAQNDTDAEKAFRALQAYTRRPWARRLLFEGHPVNMTDVDLMVLHTPGLRLPERDRESLPEEILSLTILYLVAALARYLTWRDNDRFAVLLSDECWSLLANSPGRALLLEIIRDSRKHCAGALLSTQHPGDFLSQMGDGRVSDLLGAKFAFGSQAPSAAKQSLEFMGLEPTPSHVQLVTELPNGKCLMRDTTRRLGVVEIAAADESLHQAFRTDPEKVI